VSLLSLLHYDSSVDATVVYQVFVVQVSLRCKRASKSSGPLDHDSSIVCQGFL
jgi:hypothetical protein